MTESPTFKPSSEVPAQPSPEKQEGRERGRTLHLVLVHNFTVDKATGDLEMTPPQRDAEGKPLEDAGTGAPLKDESRLTALIDRIGAKSNIVKIYTGIPKEKDPNSARVQLTVDTLAGRLQQQAASLEAQPASAEEDTEESTEAHPKESLAVRETRRREEIQRLPGTPAYYEFLGSKAKEANAQMGELTDMQAVKAAGDAIYDLWRENPDPDGQITSAEQMADRYEAIISRFNQMALRSPGGLPPATIVMVVDRAVQAWLFSKTSIPAQEMGIIQDDEPIEVTFSGKKGDDPYFTFKGAAYPLLVNAKPELTNTEDSHE